MAFYTYDQNNSGGRFRGPAEYVIVQADNSTDANELAEGMGVYFDASNDCPCCGPRWDRSYGKGDENPSIDGATPEDYLSGRWIRDNGLTKVIVRYRDGSVVRYGSNQESVA